MFGVPTATQVALNEQPDYPDPNVIRAAIDKRKKDRRPQQPSTVQGLIAPAAPQVAAPVPPVGASDGSGKVPQVTAAPGQGQASGQADPIVIDDDPATSAADLNQAMATLGLFSTTMPKKRRMTAGTGTGTVKSTKLVATSQS